MEAEPGDLLLWDSRTIHCNTPGSTIYWTDNGDDSLTTGAHDYGAPKTIVTSYDSMFSYVDTELTTVVSDGSFTAAIIAEATRRRLTWARRLGLADATVTGVTTETFSPSPAPTLAPVPSPTSLPIPSPTRAPVVAIPPFFRGRCCAAMRKRSSTC